MAKVDKQFFFENYKKYFGSLNQEQVDNLNILIDEYDSDDAMERLTFFAYLLATIYHETAATLKPIAEYGKGKNRSYGKPDSETGKTYYGRGFCQLTWRYNYKKLGDLLGIDLENNPDMAMEVSTATKIIFIGMEKGLFTGKKLSNYFTDDKSDFVTARKIINGMDRANLIAGYAKKFMDCLQYADDTPEPNGEETLADAKEAQTESLAPLQIEDKDGNEITYNPPFIL